MLNIDERLIADNRTLISINHSKQRIDKNNKDGTINFCSDDNSLWLSNHKTRDAINKNAAYYDYLDKILTAKDGINISGNYTFDDDIIFKKGLSIKNNVIIKGDLTVAGTTTNISTSDFSVTGNLLELNKGEQGQGISLKTSGLGINRGEKGFARLLYSEDDSAFIFDLNTDLDGTILNNNKLLKIYAEDSTNRSKGDVEVSNSLIANSVQTKNLLANKILFNEDNYFTFDSNNIKIQSEGINISNQLNNTIDINITNGEIYKGDTQDYPYWNKKNFDPINKMNASKILDAGTDLNTCLTEGFFRIRNAVNKPVGIVKAWVYLEVIAHSSSDILQKVYSFDGNVFYIRAMENGTWGEWATMSTNNIDEIVGRFKKLEKVYKNSWKKEDSTEMYYINIHHNFQTEQIIGVQAYTNDGEQCLIAYDKIDENVVKVWSMDTFDGVISVCS